MEVKEKNPNRIIKLCVIIGLLLITLVMGVYMINVAYHKIDNQNGVDAYFILHCIAYGLLFVLLAFVSIQAMFGTKWKTSFETFSANDYCTWIFVFAYYSDYGSSR